VTHTCLPSYMGSINRKIIFQVSAGKKLRPYPKNNWKAKKSEGMAPEVEHLSSHPQFQLQQPTPPWPHTHREKKKIGRIVCFSLKKVDIFPFNELLTAFELRIQIICWQSIRTPKITGLKNEKWLTKETVMLDGWRKLLGTRKAEEIILR
jgi:hypothetical protein